MNCAGCGILGCGGGGACHRAKLKLLQSLDRQGLLTLLIFSDCFTLAVLQGLMNLCHNSDCTCKENVANCQSKQVIASMLGVSDASCDPARLVFCMHHIVHNECPNMSPALAHVVFNNTVLPFAMLYDQVWFLFPLPKWFCTKSPAKIASRYLPGQLARVQLGKT